MGMRGAWLPALGVALLAAGFGLGIVVAGSREPVVISNFTPAPTSAAPEAPRAESAPAAPATVTPPPAPVAPTLSPEDRDALRAILDRLPRDAVPTGTGSITGQVRTDDGKPLAGVEITCSPERPRPPSPPRKPGERVPQPEMEESAVESYLWTRWLREASRSAFSDEAGRYRVEGLSDQRHQVRASLAGWNVWTRAASDGARPGAVIDFTANPTVEIRVEVSCPDGPLPDRLQMRSTDPRSGGWGLRSEGGPVWLKPGTHELYAVGGEMETHRSESQAVEIPHAAVGLTLRFVLKGRPGIRGRVILPEGQESDDLGVLLQRLADGAQPDAAALRSSGREFQGRRRSDDPAYFFPDLPPGRYAVGVARGRRGPVVLVEEVEVGTAQVERDLRVPSPDPAEYVAVTVLGAGGEVLKDFTITTGFKSGTSSSSGGSAVVRRPDGSRWVFHHSHQFADDPEGLYSITVTTREFGAATIEYRKGERVEWTASFAAPARVEIRVTGLAGSPYEDRVRVALNPGGAAPQGRGWSPGDDRDAVVDGLRVLTGIQPGDYMLDLFLAAERPSGAPLSRTPVTVRSGKNEFSIALPALHAVSVSGAEGSVVVRSVGAERTFRMITTTGGRAIVDGLVDGEYEAQSGKKVQRFTVPGTTEVKF